MQIKIPPLVRECMNILETGGFPVYIVGGCLRDSFLGRVPNDWDICTAATPKEIKAVFKKSKFWTLPTGIKHGTLTLMGKDGQLECTTFRRDGNYLDHRRPESVEFTSSLTHDLARRDFTVNAMAYSPQVGLVDPFGGRADLKAGILRCVGNPTDRFDEDALRILRLMRFVSQLGFEPEPSTLTAAAQKSGLLEFVSIERVSAELNKLLVGESACKALNLAAQCGVLAQILPEADSNDFAAVSYPPPEQDLRLAVLLKGVKDPEESLRRLRHPKKTIQLVARLIALHEADLSADPVALRRFLAEHGIEITRRLIMLKAADARAKPLDGDKLEEYKRAADEVERIVSAGEPLSLGQLAVNGSDLAQAGIPPGAVTGRILKKLLEFTLEHPSANERGKLLLKAREVAMDLGVDQALNQPLEPV